MIEIKYDKEDNIIYGKMIGEISLQDVKDFITRIHNDFSHLSTLRIIEDTRGAITIHNHDDDLYQIMDEIKERASHYKSVKTGIIVDNPKNTAISIIFEQISNRIPNYQFKAFSTIDIAKMWLTDD